MYDNAKSWYFLYFRIPTCVNGQEFIITRSNYKGKRATTKHGTRNTQKLGLRKITALSLRAPKQNGGKKLVISSTVLSKYMLLCDSISCTFGLHRTIHLRCMEDL